MSKRITMTFRVPDDWTRERLEQALERGLAAPPATPDVQALLAKATALESEVDAAVAAGLPEREGERLYRVVADVGRSLSDSLRSQESVEAAEVNRE